MGQLDEQIEGVGQGETDVDTKAALAVIKKVLATKETPNKRFLPADAADRYLTTRKLRIGVIPLLRYYRRAWYRYNGLIFVRRDLDEIQADVMRYFRDVSKQSAMTAFQSGVIANLHSICHIPNDIECPASLVRDKWKHCPDV